MPLFYASNKHMRVFAPVLILCLVVIGCASSGQSVSPTTLNTPYANRYSPPTGTFAIDYPVTTTGCGKIPPVAPGSSVNVTIAAHPAESLGYFSRTYRIHVPGNYNDTHALGVVLAFHGYGGSATGMEAGSGFSTLADRQDFLAIYPQGLPDKQTNKPFWAEIGPIDFGVDDVLFVSDILNDVQQKYCVDAHRIYATGFSNGGGVTNLLACRLAGRIAAFAPLSANAYAIPGGCHPGRPVPLLNMHGTADPLLPYNGIPVSVNPNWPLPSLPVYMQTWAARDGCTHGPTIFLREPKVTGMQWTGCRGNVSVVHYRIEGGGHAWPPLINGQTPAEVMWQFFSHYPLPAR
jgi:polyhydroxybutyrate depolymerase